MTDFELRRALRELRGPANRNMISGRSLPGKLLLLRNPHAYRLVADVGRGQRLQVWRW